MLDIKLIRQDAAQINELLQRRSESLSVDQLLELDQKRLKLLQEEEALRSDRNRLSKEVGQLKSQGQDTTELQEQTKKIADRIKQIEDDKQTIEAEQNLFLHTIPNTPFSDVPVGKDEKDNVVVKTWGDEFKSRPANDCLPHWDVALSLGMVDFERGVKVAQSRFLALMGHGAKLERALIDLMLTMHTAKGYVEVMPPFLVNAKAMFGTGQLPKFEEDLFGCKDDALYLAPTAEVPVTNLYADEIMDESQLPVYHAAFTPCFRREAGSAGRDTRGLMRLHQFNKVELVKFVHPDTSEEEHLSLLADAEAVLQKLELPYRVVQLCTGDMGFSAARCFDIEVWFPSQGEYREISSCSNFADFQSRRANIKFKCSKTGKNQFLHTLNGSGLAVGRTVAAILENYQLQSGQVNIPEALLSYFQGEKIFYNVSIKKGVAPATV